MPVALRTAVAACRADRRGQDSAAEASGSGSIQAAECSRDPRGRGWSVRPRNCWRKQPPLTRIRPCWSVSASSCSRLASSTDRALLGTVPWPSIPGTALRKRLAASVRAADWSQGFAHLQVIAKHGTPSERFNALGEISLWLESAGKIAEAIDAQEALLRLMGPGHWQLDSARRRLLSLHDKNHSLDVLEKRWRAEAESDPRDPRTALRLAKLYEFQGDDLQRHEWLSRAAALLPSRCSPPVTSPLSTLLWESAVCRQPLRQGARLQAPRHHLFAAEASALMEQEADAEERIENYLRAHADDDGGCARDRSTNDAAYRSSGTEALRAASPILTTCRRFPISCVFTSTNAEIRKIVVSRAFEASRPTSARRARSPLERTPRAPPEQGKKNRWARKAFESDPSKPEYALHLADHCRPTGKQRP